MIEKIFNGEQLKGVHNAPYWELMEKAIIAFLEHNKVNALEASMGAYQGDTGPFDNTDGVDSRVPLSHEEPGGLYLEFYLEDEFDIPPAWVYELMYRIAWGYWPKGFQHPDYCSDMGWTCEFGEKVPTDNCWHHRSVSWRRAFSRKRIMAIRMEMSLCYCS